MLPSDPPGLELGNFEFRLTTLPESLAIEFEKLVAIFDFFRKECTFFRQSINEDRPEQGSEILIMVRQT